MSLSDRRIKFTNGSEEPVFRYADEDVKISIKRFMKRIEERPNIQITHTTIKFILKEEFGEKLC